MTVSPKTLQLILQAEGLSQPSKWPGGNSGITIGHGYDLSQHTPQEFDSDWSTFIPEEQRTRLKAAANPTVIGAKAKVLASQFSDIIIRRSDAETVFQQRSIPKQWESTAKAFPGFLNLPPDVQGALVSLTYNRGTSMIDNPHSPGNRREMRAIKRAVAKGDLKEIARQLRSMKRLWEGKNLNGLLKRRDIEANLVESTIR